MVEPFGLRLRERIDAFGPLCVGIDPSRIAIEAWDRTDTVEGLEFFTLAMLEASIEVAAAIKPQVAYFERFGSAGYRILERLLSEARDSNLLVIADAKRGDIGATNEGYAEAWLRDRSPLCADAVTVSPYVGLGALESLFVAAQDTGRGVFVLAATSNSEGRLLQTARTDEGERVEDFVLRSVAERNNRDDGLGTVGVVLGATRERPAFDLALLGGPFLVPGVGAQGATPSDVGRLFVRSARATVLVNIGRGISGAGPERSALRDAAQRWRDDLSNCLS